MKKTRRGIVWLIILLVACMVLMSGCTGNTEEESGTEKASSNGESAATVSDNNELTALEAFDIAQKEAGGWASDAVLVEVNNFRGSSEPDGTSARWVVKFRSDQNDKELDVHVKTGGEIIQTLEGKNTNEEAVQNGWIDSTEAIEIAKGYFADNPADNYWFGLSSSENVVRWKIKCDYIEGEPTWVKLDAMTGEVIETREGY